MATQLSSLPIVRKNELLGRLLCEIAGRGIAQKWAALAEPHSALIDECRSLRNNQPFLVTLKAYLDVNPIIVQTVDTLLAQLAMVANSKWEDTPNIVHPLSRRGWHIGRWLPTFLIVDGPLGRVLSVNASPLYAILKSEHAKYPVLCEARDAFNHNLFRLVRNGIGHWAFIWRDISGSQQIEMVDWNSGKATVTISLLEAEALHLLAFTVVESLHNELFEPAQLLRNA